MRTADIQPGRKYLRRTAWAGFGGLILLVVLSIWLDQGPDRKLLYMLMPQAAVFALIAFTISISVAALSRRAMVAGDVLRVACWTVLAGAEGFREMGFGYYGSREEVLPVNIGAVAVMVLALATIICSRLFWPSPPPPPRAPRRGRCGECGYLLVGLPEPRCPECWTQFDPSLLDSERRRHG